MNTKSYRVAHILVSAKYEAEDILLKLRSGSSFEDLARKFSSCSSSKNGGDLGEIKIGKADENFETEVLKLNNGEIKMAPIRTPFGYHLIKRLG